MPIYRVNGKKYDIPKDKVSKFESVYPDATVDIYDNASGKGYEIPVSKVGRFKNRFPKWSYEKGAVASYTDVTDVSEAGEVGSSVEQQEAWKPTPMQKAFMMGSVQSSLNSFKAHTDASMERLKNTSEYYNRGGAFSGNKPVKGDMRYNEDAGKIEQTYLTPTGTATADKFAAERETRAYNDYVDNMTVSGQLRRAGRDLSDLLRKREERVKAIHDKWAEDQKNNKAPLAAVLGAQTYVPSIQSDPEYRALTAAIHQAEKRVQTLQHESDRQDGKDVGFWRGFGEVVGDIKTWDFGYSGLMDAMTMLDATSKPSPNRPAKTDAQKEAEQIMLEQTYEAQQAQSAYGQNDSFWNRAGVMTGEMLPFMLDFAIMGGAKGGTSMVTRNLDAVLLRSLHKAAPKIARNKAVQWTTKALGAMPEDLLYRAPLMTNTVQGMKTASDIIDRKLGDVVIRDDGTYDFSNDKTWGSAVWQGEANAIIENYSEMFGTHLEGVLSLKTVGKLADTFGAKRLSGILTKASNSELAGIAGTMQKHLNQLGVSDYFGEVGEEYYGQLWRTMLNLDDAYKQNPDGSRTNLFLDGQFHGDIWGGMALSMGLMGAGKYSISAAAYGSMKHRVNKTDTRASEIFTPEIWNGWRERIDGTTNDKIGEMAEAIVADPTLTDEQRTAAMNYMEASLNLRGFNLASVARQRGGEMSEDEAAANESYMDGYTASTPQEMNDAKKMLDLQHGRLASALSEDLVQSFDNDPIGALSVTHDPELRRIASDYVNAKMVYDGMIQRVRDDVDGRIAQSNAMIDSRINRETGMIQPATMKADDRRVYIVNGTVSMFEDGTGVDTNNSSESIIIRDAETGKVEFADPTQFHSVDEAVDAETEKEAARAQIIDEIAVAAANNIDGVLSFTPGESYSVLDLDGNPEDIAILGQPTDENGIPLDGYVDIQYPDGTIQSVATSDLQQWVDAANTRRVTQFADEREARREAQRKEDEEAYNSVAPVVAGEWLIGSGEDAISSADYLVKALSGLYPLASEAIERIRVENGERLSASIDDFVSDPSAWNSVIGSIRDNIFAIYNSQEAVDILDDILQYPKGAPYKVGQELSMRLEQLHAENESTPLPMPPGVPNSAESVPNSAENAKIPTENRDLGTETVPKTENSIDNVQQTADDGFIPINPEIKPDENGVINIPSPGTAEVDAMLATEQPMPSALSQIPTDQSGEPIYEQAEPDTAWDALVEQTEGDEDIAKSVIEQTISEKEDELKKMSKQKPKAGLSTSQKIKAEKDKKKAMDGIQQSIDHWKRMAGTKQRRQAEADAVRSAEMRKRTEEARIKAEQERAEREEAERIEREALNGVPDWSRDTPQDARARGYRRNGPQKVDRQENVASVQGKEIEVKFGDNELPKGHATIIDASALQPSHIQGSRNPAHFLDEAQPKERDDAASILSAQKIASNIRPEEITSSVTAYTGAPTVNLRGETIQGNSRSDALRLMYESKPEQAAKYRQYLIDHTSDFGLTPEQIASVERPVLVNMLDVADEEAIRLGQFVAQDTESGGIERIKPKNAVQKMGNKIRNFANILLRSEDDEASLSQLIEANGTETIKWMSRNGFITDTQYGSAFDSKGELSAKASEDLKGILYQSIFTRGSTRLEEMFSKLPAKAQRAILATAFRDYDSARADRMIEELQQSIIAFYDLSTFGAFADATNLKDALAAVEAWKHQYAMDDVTGESYLPAENFSNFALKLAAIYKGGSQKFIQQTFNDLFDAVQGTAQDTLFEEADKTPKSLAEAIKKVLDLEYQPVKQNDNGHNGSNAVDINTPQSEAGRPGSSGNADSREREPDSTEPSDSGAGTSNDSGERDEIFKEITEAYKVKIQLLDDAGENDLEITTMPLRAETKSKQIWHNGENPGSGNAFADNTYVEEVEVDVLKKPMKRTEIEDMTRKLMGDKITTATEYDQTRYGMKDGELNWGRYADKKIEEVNNFFRAKADDAVAKMKEAGKSRVSKAREKAVKDAIKARAKGENTFSDQEIEALADVVAKEAQDKEETKQYRRREEINNVRDHIKHLLGRLRAGHIYVVPQDLKQATADMFTQTFGTFVGFKFNKSYTLGSSTAIFATLDGRRKVELALSDKAIDTIIRCTDTAIRYSPREINAISMENWDSKVPTQTRQTRHIITGNLLQALVDTEKGEKTKGNLISFSTKEGNTRQGILMSENFKPTDLRSSVPLRSRLKQIQDGKTIVSENGDVQIEKVSFGWEHRGYYELRVPKSKQRGGIYTMNPALLKLVDGKNFVTKGNNMVGYVTPENLAKVVDMLSRTPFNLTVLEESKLTEEDEDVRYRLEEVANKIEKLFDEAVAGNLRGKPVSIGTLTDEGREYLEKISGVSFKEEVSFVLNPSDLLHIYIRHFGANEKDGRNIPLRIEDIRNISNIITNPDKVVHAKEKDGQKRNMFFFLKETADGSYNLMEIYSDRKGNLTAKSYFKSKEGVSQRAMLLRESSTLTSVTDGATLFDGANLPKFFELSTDGKAESLERDGYGAYSDAEVSMENGPWSKAWGESIRTKRQQKQFAERERKRMRDRAKSLSSVLGIDIEVIEDASSLKGKKQRAKGWYDTKTGKITVVVGNHNSAADMEATILHEAVAHHGLRQLLGEHFDEFLDKVYEAADNGIKEQIDLLASRNGWNRRVATEEYLAGLAEETEFDRAEERVSGWFDKIKRFFIDMLFKAGFKHIKPGSIGDNELRYILWRSYQNLANPGRYRAFEWEAEDVAMQYKLQIGKYDTTSEKVESAADSGIRFRDGDFTPRDQALAAKQYERMLSRGSWQFREATQDSMLGLKTLYESILGSNTRIENVAGYENAYLYENRMSSANNGEQHQYFSRFMKPLLESIHKLCGNMELDRRILTDYMMAKHGLERNEYMRNEAAANGEDTERDFAGLCGLTGEDDWQVAETVAQQMVDDYESDHDTAELWNNVKKATNATLEKIYLSGLISEDTYNKVLGMYDFYIPLRGWDETTSDEVYGYLTSKDGPLMGNVFKIAGGRESKADDPIATIAMMADDAIRQGNRNIMKQRFLNFVHGNPSDLVSVNEMWLQHNDVTDEWEPVFADLQPDMTHAEVDSEIAKFEAKMEALRTSEPDKYKKGRDARNIPYKVVRGNLNEHQVLVKRNGRTYVMTINGNPRAAQALNGLTNPDTDMGGVIGNMLKLGEYVNRHLSAFYTTRNPDFVVSNFMRDMLYSNCMTWVKENPRYALRFHKNFGKVNPLTLRRLLSKWENDSLSDSNYIEKMFKEFMLNGGETGYTSVKDIEGHKRTIASELKKQGSTGRKAWSALGMQLDLLNRSAENCARFAAFLTSREMGRTLDRSIHDAKEVSVNFNKKGSGGKFVNATGQKLLGKIGSYLGGGGRIAFVFWNAGIQGMTNFGRAGKRNPGKAIGGATALFTLGYVIPLLAQMLGGGDGDDDDKNAYYNLPEYVRRSNICFKAGEQWITIPLPIEYRAIYGMGELACGVISGNERYSNSELTRQMASQISQVMPLDMLEGGGGISPFIPSAFKPMTEAYILNKGWTGLPVYKDTPYNKNDPEWTKAYQSADQHLVAFTRWLNETSGGDDYKKGAIDINPAKLEYLLSGTFGGVVSTTGKLKKMGETALGTRVFEWRNMLLANRVIKSGDERTANRKLQNEYFKYLTEYEETNRLRKKYENAADDGILGYAERVDFLYNSAEYLRFGIFEKYKPDIDAIREEIKEETNPEAKKELQGELFSTMRELVDELHDVGK